MAFAQRPDKATYAPLHLPGLHAGHGLNDLKNTLDSPETANVGVTETD